MDSGVVGRGLGRVETGMLAEMASQVSPWFASSLPGPATADDFTSHVQAGELDHRGAPADLRVREAVLGRVRRHDLQLQDGMASGATPA